MRKKITLKDLKENHQATLNPSEIVTVEPGKRITLSAGLDSGNAANDTSIDTIKIARTEGREVGVEEQINLEVIPKDSGDLSVKNNHSENDLTIWVYGKEVVIKPGESVEVPKYKPDELNDWRDIPDGTFYAMVGPDQAAMVSIKPLSREVHVKNLPIDLKNSGLENMAEASQEVFDPEVFSNQFGAAATLYINGEQRNGLNKVSVQYDEAHKIAIREPREPSGREILVDTELLPGTYLKTAGKTYYYHGQTDEGPSFSVLDEAVDTDTNYDTDDELPRPRRHPGYVDFQKTEYVVARLEGNRFFEEASPEHRYGKFADRAIIGRDVPIDKGVYLGGGAREAIVVDGEKQPRLDAAYQDLAKRIENKGGNYKRDALEEVFDYASEALRYDMEEVDQVHKNVGGYSDQKIGLDRYLKAGAGVCRHQALLCGYLLERLIKDGHLSGNVSVDRNQIKGKGGHAWLRYTTKSGRVVILDVAQKFIGTLDELTQRDNRWIYERPEDKLRGR